MELTVATLTDVGRARTNNEDAHFADADLGLFIVCDGMGGHNAGEVASSKTCEVLAAEITRGAPIRQRFLTTGGPADAEALRQMVDTAMRTACREVFRRASREPELAGMGTTCTLVLLLGHDKAVLAHVGDSRLYVCRNGQMHQLTEDHTYVNELIRRGSLTREQARNHPQGNVLSRALGVQPSVAVDSMVFDIDRGDTYLLCSDGLHNYFPNVKELVPPLTKASLNDGLALLIHQALERGGHDNITGVAFRVSGALESTEAPLAADHRIYTLKRLPLFAHLSYNELAKVVGLTQLARAAPGQTLVREGESGSELFVVLAGDVEVQKSGRAVAALKAGAHFGEMAMIDNAPRSATVVAKTGVFLLVMRRPEFFSLVRSEPVIASKLLWSFLQVFSGRLRDTTQALDSARDDAAGAELDVPFADDAEGES